MKLVRFLLYPFAIIYDAVTTTRNYFFDIDVFESTKFKIPVIIVGNLSVGGTGKTPQIEYLIRLLKNNFKIAVLSRGYKRKTAGFVLLNEQHTALDVGDEPLQYFKKFKNIDVAVDADRVHGIELLKNIKNPEIILLDDAFQHRKVTGSFYILLTKYNDLFIDDFLLPTGNLRESSSGAHRASVILVTKCPADLTNKQQAKIKARLKKYNKEVFFTTIGYANSVAGNKEITLQELQNYQVLLITGIANPTPLIQFLSDKKINFIHLKFGDHHHFSSKEIEAIEQKFKKIEQPNKLILTTEKDYTRLENKLDNLCFIEIETMFLGNQNLDFNKMIQTHIQKS